MRTKVRKYHGAGNMFAVILLHAMLAVLIAGCAAKECTCACGCPDCDFAKSGRIFNFKKEKLSPVTCFDFYVGNYRSIVEVGDEETDRIIDILNAFVLADSEDISDSVGCEENVPEDSPDYFIKLRVGLMYDFIYLSFNDSSIKMGGMLYTGEEGCLAELVEIYESLPKREIVSDG